MKFLLAVFSLLITICAKSQTTDFNTIDKAVDEMGEFWKMDSLGSNGFRYCYTEKLLTKKIVDISCQTILEKLGRPNMAHSNSNNTRLIYITYDPRHMPWLKGRSFEYFIVTFVFSKSTQKLIEITKGHGDL